MMKNQFNKSKQITNRFSSPKKYFWFYWIFNNPRLVFLSFIGLIFTIYMQTLPNYLIGIAIDDLKGNGLSSQFYNTINMIFFAAGAAWILNFTSNYFWALASFRFEKDARQDFFEVLQIHSMAFHDVHDSGVLLSMGMNEVDQIRRAYNPAMRMIVSSILTMLITIYFLTVIRSEIGIALAVCLIIYLGLAYRYSRNIGPIRRKLANELGELSSSSQEIFRGIDIVRSFNSEEIEKTKFDLLSNRYAETVKKEGYLTSFYWPGLILIILTAVAFGFSVLLLIDGVLTPGEVTSVIALLLALNRLNLFLPRALLMVQAGMINSERIWDIMNFDDPMQEPLESQNISWDKDIKFNDVSFKYPNTDKYVLTDLNFNIPPGSRVALIGGPGSGKSTLLKLLLRLYDPTNGSIMVDGVILQDVLTKDVRDAVTMVEQDIFLFSDTIYANIIFSKPNASDTEVREAARLAQAANFIEVLPDGYNTVIGEKGVTLSGGQRQRLAIARALLSKPSILLLDDSTSAIDVITEAQLQKAMKELIHGRTSIIVTQRLSTLAEADLIILLKKGKNAAMGTHNELLENSEDYQFMCKHLPHIDERLNQARKDNLGQINSKDEKEDDT